MTVHAAEFVGHILKPLCGTTGDSLTMTHGENLKLADCVNCQNVYTARCTRCDGDGKIYSGCYDPECCGPTRCGCNFDTM